MYLVYLLSLCHSCLRYSCSRLLWKRWNDIYGNELCEIGKRLDTFGYDWFILRHIYICITRESWCKTNNVAKLLIANMYNELISCNYALKPVIKVVLLVLHIIMLLVYITGAIFKDFHSTYWVWTDFILIEYANLMLLRFYIHIGTY